MEATPISPQMRMYYKRKEAGLCIECGKPLNDGKLKCRDCRERINANRKELVHWYQDNGICPECRQNNLMGDERICPECSAKRYSQRIARYNTNPEEFKARDRLEQKKIRARRAEKGLCVKCGKVKADSGYKTCTKCRIKARNTKRNKRKDCKVEQQREWVANGKCWLCGEPVFNHTKLCEMHYEKSLEYIRKSVEARRKNEQARAKKISRANDESSNEQQEN